MELEAAINGLLVLTESCSVTVITDSKYLQQGITVYLVRWQNRGWRNSRGEAIANRDLWERVGIGGRPAQNDVALGPRPRI
jgi:ribonuclease HI